MNGGCHCGAVTLEVPGPPEFLNQCNCTACWKLGTLWGYYTGAEVRVSGPVASYRRADLADSRLLFNFCGTCGATTHWSYAGDSAGRTGINMRLFDPAALVGVGQLYGDRRTGEQGERKFWHEPTRFAGVERTA